MKEEISVYIKEIIKKKGSPYIMCNEALAEDIYLHIKVNFPNAKIIRMDSSQYITISNRAENSLIKILNQKKKHYENIIRRIGVAELQLVKTSPDKKMNKSMCR